MKFVIKGTLTTLNEYTRISRGNKYASAQLKRNTEELIVWQIKSQLKGWRTDKKVALVFHWVEPNHKRDKDNVCFAKKFILDALVKSGTIVNDNWKYIEGFTDQFSVDRRNPRIEVEIIEVAGG